MANEAAPAKRPRGRPRKSREELRRDRAASDLDNLRVWLMVESKRKGVAGMSVSLACKLIAEEVVARREVAPKIAREILDQDHKHLLNADTLRRCHARAETLRRQDRSVAEYCARELARLGPWASTTRRRQPRG
jgi:hypothetical protein